MKRFIDGKSLNRTFMGGLYAALLCSAVPCFAGNTTGADFLKIPIGAEPASLGQAYTAMSHGINALNWNPAGILQTPIAVNRPSLGLSLSHQDQIADSTLDHVGFIIPQKSNLSNSWGVDLLRLSYADQEGRDVNRQRTSSLSSSDMAFGAAYAHNFGFYQLGTQVKFIRQELAGAQADGLALDAGLLSATPMPKLSMGLSVRNLGPRMRLTQESYDLPLTLSLGGAYRVSTPLILAIDIHHKPYQHQTVFSLGTQLAASQNIMLRAGYLTRIAEAVTNNQKSETNRGNDLSGFGISGLSGGFGLSFKQFSLDYALMPFGELGNTQMLTLSTWFGKADEEPDAFGPTPEVPTTDRLILIIPVSQKNWWDAQ